MGASTAPTNWGRSASKATETPGQDVNAENHFHNVSSCLQRVLGILEGPADASTQQVRAFIPQANCVAQIEFWHTVAVVCFFPSILISIE
jgi:hypothetical protein